jgi:hypothetical protein
MWVFPEGRTWIIIGIHDANVKSVEGDVARVRMLVGDEMVDEDLPLPVLPSWITPSPEVYEAAMVTTIAARQHYLQDHGLESLAPGSLIHPKPVAH